MVVGGWVVGGYWLARVMMGAPRHALAREGWKGYTIVGVVGKVEFHRL